MSPFWQGFWNVFGRRFDPTGIPWLDKELRRVDVWRWLRKPEANFLKETKAK